MASLSGSLRNAATPSASRARGDRPARPHTPARAPAGPALPAAPGDGPSVSRRPPRSDRIFRGRKRAVPWVRARASTGLLSPPRVRCPTSSAHQERGDADRDQAHGAPGATRQTPAVRACPPEPCALVPRAAHAGVSRDVCQAARPSIGVSWRVGVSRRALSRSLCPRLNTSGDKTAPKNPSGDRQRASPGVFPRRRGWSSATPAAVPPGIINARPVSMARQGSMVDR
jgi:hypothetical protein